MSVAVKHLPQSLPSYSTIPSNLFNVSGCEFSEVGLTIEPGMRFENWQRLLRSLERAEQGIQWYIGDALNYGEQEYGDRYSQVLDAHERTGIPIKTLRDYQYVADKVQVAVRTAGVDWSTHREVATLNPTKQRAVLQRALKEDLTKKETKRAVNRIKREQGHEKSELEILATPEVQQFLDDYIVKLKEAEETLPGTATFLRNMIERHQSQALWQKGRTVSGDCDVILTAIDETGGLSDDDLFTWLQNRGYFMRDPELDDRLTYMVEHQMILEDDAGQDGRQEGRRGKLPTFYVRWYKKRTKVQRCKVCDEYHKDDADCLELSILTD